MVWTAAGKLPVSAKVLTTAVVAGVSIESVVIGAAVGGIFLVIQGVVETVLGQYLREKRNRDKKRGNRKHSDTTREKEGVQGEEVDRVGEHSSGGPADSGLTPAYPEFEQRDDSET